MRPSSAQPDPRSIGRENVCSPIQHGCCGVYATRPVPEVSPLLKQPVRHHADFSPRGICFSSAARKCGCPILSLGKGGTKSRPSICLSSLADFSPRGICFSRSDNEGVGSRVTQEDAPVPPGTVELSP